MGRIGSRTHDGRPDTSTSLAPVPGVPGLGRLDLIDAAEADRVSDEVVALRPRWTSRSPHDAFYTLGANAYMDLAQSRDPAATYFGPAGRVNAILREHFGDLYADLAAALGDVVGLPARYADELALPGFHIWTARGIPRSPSASLHFDLQYEPLRRRPSYAAATGTLSFTLPVRLPVDGSSLLVWPTTTYPAADGVLAAARSTDPRVVGYEVGQAVVHSGHVLHQIGPTPSVRPTDLRITLQGHGLVVADELVLYW